MAADYLLEFEAHIDERKRPEGFPHSVFIREQYHALEEPQLKQLYNDRVKTIVTNPGIVIFPEEETIDASKLNFDQRVYIPWHMITHFHGTVKIMTPPPAKLPLESLSPADQTLEENKTVIQ